MYGGNTLLIYIIKIPYLSRACVIMLKRPIESSERQITSTLIRPRTIQNGLMLTTMKIFETLCPY